MEILKIYLTLNLLLVLGALLSKVATMVLGRPRWNVSAKSVVRLHFGILTLCLLATVALPFLPEAQFVRPLPQVFDSSTVNEVERFLMPSATTQVRPLNPMESAGMIPWRLFAGIFLCGILLRLFFLIRKTRATLTRAYGLRSHGRLQILVSEQESIPYAFSFFRRSYVSVPACLLCEPQLLKVAIQHEVQHIRQGDTISVYLLEIVKALCFWNPAVRLWVKDIILLQEFSCDEALIVHGKVHPREYAGSLFEVAQLSEDSESRLFGATGFLFGPSRSQLLRRIEEMKNIKNKRKGILFGGTVSVLSLLFLGATAMAAKSMMGFGRLSVDRVSVVVESKEFSKDFPVTVNEAVVRELNKLVGTPRGRRFSRMAIRNYQKHEGMIQEALKRFGHPKELASVAFIESAYRNLPQSPHPMKSAGMWQFIPETARNYDLVVTNSVDERQNIRLATDAALRYLGALNLRFKDWRLAMLSYNAGEGRVQRGINDVGSRDPWKLIDEGFGGDKGYLAKVMAAVILMKAPELLN